MAFTSFTGPDFSFESLAVDQGPLLEQLAAWHRRASAAGRVPCLYLTAGWCPPSVALEKSLSDPGMQRALRRVDAATLDVDRWGDALTAAGIQVRTVPVFFVLGADGSPVGPGITGGAWGENTPENMAPPLERFFDGPRGELQAPAAAASAYAPPQPPQPVRTGSGLSGVVMLIAAIVGLGFMAWFKVKSDEQERRAADEAAREQRIRDDVQESIRSSLREQQNK